MRNHDTTERLLTPGEVAQRAGVDPKTVARWAQTGKIPSIRTLGGHRRFRSSDVERLFPVTHEASVPPRDEPSGL